MLNIQPIPNDRVLVRSIHHVLDVGALQLASCRACAHDAILRKRGQGWDVDCWEIYARFGVPNMTQP